MRKWGTPIILDKKPENWELQQLTEYLEANAKHAGMKSPVVVFGEDFLKAFNWTEISEGVYACGWYADE